VLAPILRSGIAVAGFARRQVSGGAPLAIVDSPDFAAALSAYQQGARDRPKPAAGSPIIDKDLVQHQRRLATRSGAGRNRRHQRRGGPRCRPAGTRLAESRSADRSRTFRRAGRSRESRRVIRAPIAGTVVEKLITPGELLQAGTTPCFTIADLSRVWVMAQISVPTCPRSLGDPAEVVTGIAPPGAPRKSRPTFRRWWIRTPVRCRARRRRQPGEVSEEADVRPRADSGARGKHGLTGPGFGDSARRREPAVCLRRPERRQLCARHVTLGYRAGGPGMKSPTGPQGPVSRSSSTAASSFNSCKINERPRCLRRIRAAIRVDHEPHRRLLIAAALSRRPA
jgi:biotin carboxyl carrier protein